MKSSLLKMKPARVVKVPKSVLVGISDSSGEPCCAHAFNSKRRTASSHKKWVAYVLAESIPSTTPSQKMEKAAMALALSALRERKWYRTLDEAELRERSRDNAPGRRIYRDLALFELSRREAKRRVK